MNRPPENHLDIDADKLRSFAASCGQSSGMYLEDAEQLAELLTNSDLRGVHSHGTRSLPGYCHTIRDGKANARPHIKTLRETAATVQLDGDGALGYRPMMQATDMAVAKARETGIGMGAVCHIGHYGSAGHYVRRAMEQGCTAFSVQGAYPQYYLSNKGKSSAYYGNPPLCFGLPSANQPPLVLDGATCILADNQYGKEYDALQQLIPAALFKSMGYTGVATALGGVFVGQAGSSAQEIARKWPSARMGGLVIAFPIDVFAPAAEFREGIDQMVELVKEEMEPLQGYNEATLPGTLEHRCEQEYRRHGIPLSLDTVEQLKALGRDLDVRPPWH